ncbi:unnamed protein product [Brachionus calyciflorus]|uniref:Uncharacterized protein n=1 Tax=Brachionus calyciflorus TaxID=104777 RepID=A0A813Q854_9BILA|nr:unnamed protein product [Brachionus calyciflorus]
MYKVIFYKFFLFVLYLTAGLMSKLNEYSKETNNPVLSANDLQNGDSNQIGEATIWVNPFITRFKVPTTTTTTTTTTVSTRRTLKPLERSILLEKMTTSENIYYDYDYNLAENHR